MIESWLSTLPHLVAAVMVGLMGLVGIITLVGLLVIAVWRAGGHYERLKDRAEPN